MDSSKEQAVIGLPHVRWLGIYQPSYRISKTVFNKIYVKDKESPEARESRVLLRVTVFPGENLERIKDEISTSGGIIMDEITTKWKSTFKVKIPADRIGDLTSISGIKFIEPFPEWKLFRGIKRN